MTSPSPLGVFGNPLGLDGIIILGLQIAWVVGLILLVRFLVRRSTPAARLGKLDSLRDRSAITAAEYQEQRRRILMQV